MTLVTSWPQFVPHAQPLIKSLAQRALGNSSSQEGESCLEFIFLALRRCFRAVLVAVLVLILVFNFFV